MHASQDPIIVSALVTGLLLCLLFCAFIAIIVRMQRRYYRQHQAAVQSELDTLRKERFRIAADLHDDINPRLVLAFRQLEAIKEGRVKDEKLISDAYHHIRYVLDRTCLVIYNLDDSRILKLGLEQTIRFFLNQHQEASSLHITFAYKVQNEPSDVATISVYRMLQELVQNSIKHSDAKELNIAFREWKGMLYFYYGDNGTPFKPVHSPDGMGLKSLRQRILFLGGSMEVKHLNGTHYHFQIPIS